MPICPFCNEENPAEAEVCKKCGNAIPREEPAEGEPDEFERELLELLKGGRKIEAIKVYRAKMGQGLKEAKDAVEALAAKHGIESKRVGCAGMVLLVLLLPLAWRLLG
jgi:ribosomal protein L7/L12